MEPRSYWFIKISTSTFLMLGELENLPMLDLKACLKAIEWDDQLPSYFETQWRQWFNEARGIKQVK